MGEWPVRMMVYGAGEAIDGSGDLSGFIGQQLARLERVCTNSAVAATAQLDASNAATRRFVLDPNGRQPVHSLPNVNVGDPAQLIDFAVWSAAICPAARSILVLSGHGIAWQDAKADELLRGLGPAATRSPTAVPRAPGAVHHARALFGRGADPVEAMARAVLIDGRIRDYLSNAELGAVCQRISQSLGRPVDVLVLDACLMSSVEVLQELRGSVAAVVGSIDELSAAGIDMAAPAQRMSAGMDGSALARVIAGEFTPATSFDSCVAVDLAGAAWGDGLSAFQVFCSQFLAWVRAGAGNAVAATAALRSAGSSVVKFSGGDLADLGALAAAIEAIPSLPLPVSRAIRLAADRLGAGVIARRTGADYRDAIGLSVFTPGSVTAYLANRPDYTRLQFANLTGWIAVLDAVHGFASDGVRLVSGDGAGARGTGDDVEFVVSLRGLPGDDNMRERLVQLVRRTVLGELARLDALQDSSIISLSAFISVDKEYALTGLPPDGFAVLGIARGLPVPEIQPFPPGMTDLPTDNDQLSHRPRSDRAVELHVLLRGIPLDDTAKTLIDAAIQSAVLQEIAVIDNKGVRRIGDLSSDPRTRSLFPRWGGGPVLGLVADFGGAGDQPIA